MPSAAIKGDPHERRAVQRQRVEAERAALVKHLEKQDARLRQTALEKQAAVQKRLASAFDPRPARRKMYDDSALAQAATIPGPGTYSPLLREKDSSAGKTFGATPFTTVSGSSSIPSQHVRDKGSPDAWKVKNAAMQPGPASYTPVEPRSARGSTFGLPPKLRANKIIPTAHDMGKMVEHLRDLPAPDAYSPRNHMEKNMGFRMVPSTALSSLEKVMQEAEKVPGPGSYNLAASLSRGRSTLLGGGGMVKSELEIVMERAKEVPGPGAYKHASHLRSRGSPRFASAGGLTMFEAIQVEARAKPGPGTYHPTPTFTEELDKRRYLRAAVKGLEGGSDVTPRILSFDKLPAMVEQTADK